MPAHVTSKSRDTTHIMRLARALLPTAMGVFIPPSKLENLRLYKYSSEDHSLISKYVLKRWWNLFVTVFPMNMAPNVITLLGLVFILVNLLCVFYYDPYLNTPSPRWCYFFYAFGLFMYQTFDGCDGCHARRTGQSGPLGELFDHSIDAINTTLGLIIFASVLQFGYGWKLFLTQLATVANFYASTWEEYHTHTLFLSEFSGPVEGILLICLVYILTGLKGPQFWTKPLVEVDLLLLPFGVGVVAVDAGVVASGVGLVQLYFNIALATRNVVRKYATDGRLLKLAAAAEVLRAKRGLVPFFAYYASVVGLVWVFPECLSVYAFPLILSVGLLIAFSVGRIILAHLTLQAFPYVNLPLFIPVGQLLLAFVTIYVFGYDRDSSLGAIMWTGMGLSLGIHAMFVTDIIHEITSFLDIYALFIKHKKV